MRDRIFRVIIRFLVSLAPGGMFLPGVRDDDDPARVRILPAGHRQADERDDVGACLRMVLVLSLGSFFSFVILVGDGVVSVLPWQFFSTKPA